MRHDTGMLHSMRWLSLSSLLILLSGGVAGAQSPADVEAAAARILAQDTLRFRVLAGPTPARAAEADLKLQRISFLRSEDTLCYGNGVPTRAGFAAPHIVVEVRPAVRGCPPMQYRVDPISGEGRIWVVDTERQTWVESTGSRVVLEHH